MALRTFTAPDGILWHVYNVEPASTHRLVTPGLENGWLVFESDTHKCRINPIPRGWETCSESELFALMRNAKPVRKTMLSEPPEP
jgi:hypothetical protein